tara:strand:- start:5152 stop:5388 length:237 start_codon:yes stop_codon:yes gene_type:complete
MTEWKPPGPEDEIESLDDFVYIYRCSHCKAKIEVEESVSPGVAQELAISEYPDWIFYQSETFCSKNCEDDFDNNAQKV